MLEVCFIGTGDAFGSGGRRNSAILLREGSRTILLDCGVTTHTGLRQCGVDPTEIDSIVISHFHADHAAGVPFLLLGYLYEDRRERPLQILGPRNIEEVVMATTRAFHFDTGIERRYPLEFVEFQAGERVETAGFGVIPKPAFHHPHTHPHILRVESDDRALVFSGDTGWHEELPEKVGDVDLFISECVYMEESFEYHLSHARLDAERERFKCGSIILTHLGSEVLGDLGRVRFDSAHDGMRLKV